MDMEHEIKKDAPSAQQAAGSIDTPAELPRYDLVETQYGSGYMAHWDKALELDQDGEWCKYADVAAIIATTVAQPIAVSAPTDQSPYEAITLANLRAGKLSAARVYVGYCELSEELKAANGAIKRYEAQARAAAPVSRSISDDVGFAGVLGQYSMDVKHGKGISATLPLTQYIDRWAISAAPVSGPSEQLYAAIERLRQYLQMNSSTIDIIHEIGPMCSLDEAWQIMHDEVCLALDSRPRSEDSRAKVRNAALEEAAEFCETDYRTENGWGVTCADNRCAAGIRALASTTPQKADDAN